MLFRSDGLSTSVRSSNAPPSRLHARRSSTRQPTRPAYSSVPARGPSQPIGVGVWPLPSSTEVLAYSRPVPSPVPSADLLPDFSHVAQLCVTTISEPPIATAGGRPSARHARLALGAFSTAQAVLKVTRMHDVLVLRPCAGAGAAPQLRLAASQDTMTGVIDLLRATSKT